MKFNEDSRVKIPTILHLCRLGYQYLSLKGAKYDDSTNVFTDIFKESIQRINPDLEEEEVNRFYQDTLLTLDNEDLGNAFYEKLIAKSGTKLIDFENFDNNSFHVLTELTYKNGDEEFRPDIILLINGMPLAFIEVKKPNNRDGIIAERDRINTRFQNKKFRKFVNITQLMVFSNNMEYDDFSPEPIEGAFYASASYHNPIFNYFREEEQLDLSQLLKEEEDELENFVLKDNNLAIIKHSPEFITNKDSGAPTNRICTSLFSHDRLAFILKYAITYVKEKTGLEKHIMRYPQIFATKAIENKLNDGIRKGIIWHTQGSGKTALAFYNVKHLTDYYQKKGIVPKFYFIVDRLDLLIQAGLEFRSRGLIVHNVNSREEFARDIKSTAVIHNNSGKAEITVVNIQKFKDDPAVVRNSDYNVNVQRIYFLDEVHRSYNPKGSFLANLKDSDEKAIKIGLTGTPLLGDDYNSKALFGNYIHKYYYNASIADGYTLRLIREEIETRYKLLLEETLKKIEVLEGDIPKKEIYAHHRFVEPMLDYIISDFEKARHTFDDPTIGGMVVCDSSDQAKMMFEIFNSKYAQADERIEEFDMAAESIVTYATKKKQKEKVKTAALILHDIGTKDERKTQVEEFKEGKFDFLFVYNMLLTGFDAKRLKKMYLGRVIKRHNLLQTLTRVNRTYKNFKYGYVVDFADIKSEFDATNKAYFDELQEELGDEMQHYSDLFKSKEEIEEEILNIKETLFKFDTQNAEIFSQQISKIQDRKTMLGITKALNNARELYNLIRLTGHYEILEQLDFKKINILAREASNHLALINQKEAIENSGETTNLLNIALEDVIFAFTKISQDELKLADELKDTLRKTREALAGNFDKKDAKFVSLKEELERLFKKRNLNEITQEEMQANIGDLNKIFAKIAELNRQNNLLKAKYNNDEKYARIHKRLVEKGNLTKRESQIFEALNGVKTDADNFVLQNTKLLNNENYFNSMMVKLLLDQFMKKNKITLDAEGAKYINHLVVKEYMDEFHGRTAH
ncbi:type I restriction endonuclease subunit R [Labilibaculum sp. A4]|uniref:type I restriction endonuclease subunit R n=1 Tax=Labilibaculum euxinus TaxID=2686357 RepID=UPI000F619416|nr:type I restriction endonuclease [Labilibaculum euxinus]MDQ1770215.1 type I restriction endonuclease [Labilibaculum euxinus]MWN77571.1 type I restriction endonuclease subunit R [Labilibaculum euxinus]